MRRILVVEDSVSARAFVRAVLESPDFGLRVGSEGGCEVIEAEAELKALQRHAFAVVDPEAPS